jgi:hypothetical protein
MIDGLRERERERERERFIQDILRGVDGERDRERELWHGNSI